MKLNLRTQLMLQFLILGIVPMMIMGWVTYINQSASLIKLEYNLLKSAEKNKEIALNRYAANISHQTETLSGSLAVQQALEVFDEHFSDLVVEAANVDGSSINELRTQLARYYSSSVDSAWPEGADSEWSSASYVAQLSDEAIAAQTIYLAKNASLISKNKDLVRSPFDQSAYGQKHERVHGFFRDYAQRFDFKDIFLVNGETGIVSYSVNKGIEFGSNLNSGPLANTQLGRIFRRSLDEGQGRVLFEDFSPYAGTFNQPSAFTAAPVSINGNNLGILIVKITPESIENILVESTGLGQTGETLLIAQDYSLRSKSRLEPETFNISSSFASSVQNRLKQEDVRKALAGEEGQTETVNYLGHEVLSVYRPVRFLGETWAFIAHIDRDEALHSTVILFYWILGLTIACSLIILAYGYWVGNGITGPIQLIAKNLQEHSDMVSNDSETMESTAHSLSNTATEQASSLQETAASVEQISQMVENNVDQAENSARVSAEVREAAEKGNAAMRDLISAMEEILRNNKDIQNLVKVIQDIGEKTEVIDEIVFQTKLLSFNASVEAERAGEHGRGFAVVAQEVGNLAQMSGKASVEIATMVKSSIKTAEQLTKESQEKVETGHKLVTATAGHLEEISMNSGKLTEQANQIVQASREQSAGINQVNEAMSQLDQGTQMISENSNLVADASSSLSSGAQNLHEEIGELRGMIYADKNASTESSRVAHPHAKAQQSPARASASSKNRSSNRKSQQGYSAKRLASVVPINQSRGHEAGDDQDTRFHMRNQSQLKPEYSEDNAEANWDKL